MPRRDRYEDYVRPDSWDVNRDSPQAFGLWAWYPLDDVAGTVARERTFRHDGQTLDGFGAAASTPTASSGWGWAPDGQPAIHLDGSNDFLNGDTDLGMKLAGDLTLSAWVWMDAIPADGSGYCVAGYSGLGETSADNHQWALFINNAGGVVTLEGFHESGSGTNQRVSSTLTVAAGAWQHVVLRRNNTTLTYDFFVNGVADAGGTYAANPTGGADATFEIGADRQGTLSFFDGWMRDLRFFDRVLPDSLCQAMYLRETRYEMYGQLLRPGRRRSIARITRPFPCEAVSDLAVSETPEVADRSLPPGQTLISVP